MPLDPVLGALFAQMPMMANFPMWDRTPTEARRAFKTFCQFAEPQMPIGKIENLEAPGPGGPVKLRVYTPIAAGGAALPGLVFFHGGGFVVGDLDCYEALCRTLANESGCRVVSVDYRLAPEHKFPAAVDDCFAALKWIEANAMDHGIDANRIAVAGDSAGGNLAAVMCLLAKDNKNVPNIDFQVLIYPATAYGIGTSEDIYGQGYFLTSETMKWFFAHYVPEGADLSDPRLSPLEAKDMSGLPPAYIVTAGFDPLRDSGVRYAEKLKTAGVAVAHVDYPSMIHGFFSMQGLVPLASEAIAAAAHAVKEALV
jgi:acetyl esterase